MSFWDSIRSDFPITEKCIYLDHAAGSPIAHPVREQILRYYRENSEGADFAWTKWIARREEARRKVAQFIGADPSEIAFIHSTSEGMNLVAELLAGEGAVLTNESEFPSSTLPWIWRKAKIVWQKPENGKIPLEKLKTLLSPKIKTIVTSFVQYATGFRQDLEGLGKIKGDRYLVINATQGFGAFPIDVRKWKADFLVTNSYKWLMAGYGGGVLYIRKKWLARFKPRSIGWRSMKNPEVMDNRLLDLKVDASRYESGCPDFSTIFGVGAAAEYLAGIGMGKIQKRILELTDFAIRGLEEKGFKVVSPKEAGHRSGIVVFEAKDAARICRRLAGEKIYVSPRGAGIRIAPHFYNSFEEIETFLKKWVEYAAK